MRRSATGVAALVAPLLIVGCGSKPEAEGVSRQPPVVAFQGQVDPTIVGSWKTSDKRSGLDLGKEGSLHILATSSSPAGPVTSNLDGSWLCSDHKLLMKYASKGQPESVVQYNYSLAGGKLTLSDKSGRMKTVYIRK